jgi:hypothetical protein
MQASAVANNHIAMTSTPYAAAHMSWLNSMYVAAHSGYATAALRASAPPAAV